MDSQIAELKHETREKNLEVRRLADQNQENISTFRKVLDEAEAERKQRDEFNSKVREISDKRKQLIEVSRQIDADLAAKEKEAEKYKVPEGRIPLPRLKLMVERMEWKLQTEGMSVKEENALSQEIRKLLKEKEALEKSQPLRKEIYELRKRRQELNMEFRALEGAQEYDARESDKHHEKMLQLYKRADELRAKISEYLEMIGEKRKDADESYLKLTEARNTAEAVESRERAKERHEKRKKEEERMDELEERAKQIYIDFKAGKKISMEELQVLQAAGLEI